jgi:UDPglucose 6-dehydrogenase
MIIEPHRHLLDLKLGDLWRYRDLDWAEIKEILGNPLLLDGRNFLDRHELERLGYRYVGVGR